MRNSTDKASEIIAFAKKFVGVPYKYGATMEEAPKYFDCSGFIKYIFEKFGYEIPRSTLLQASYAGKKVSRKKIGDLIFFKSTRGHYSPKVPQGVGHVALYIGGEKIIHATAKMKKDYPEIILKNGEVRIDTLKKSSKEENKIVMIKRVIK